MKIRKADLIAALDVQIAEGRALVDENNAKTAAENAAALEEWQSTRAKLVTASKALTKTLQSRTFDGNVGAAVDAALGEQGFERRWGEREFRHHNAPKAKTPTGHDTELAGLRTLLAAVDEEWVSVSVLERLGFKSRQFAALFRSLFLAQKTEAKA